MRYLLRLIGLVKPLIARMIMAISFGLFGHLAATFISVLGAYSILYILGIDTSISLSVCAVLMIILAVLRAIFRYIEQNANHYIAFRLLALIRHKVFVALRKLAPSKLDGQDKGDLISIITTDIELLEVFYAHTISPVMIAILYSIIMVIFITMQDIYLGLIALFAYITVGIILPIIVDKINGDTGIRFREKSGALSSFVLGSLRGIEEIVQYGGEKERLKTLVDRSNELKDYEKKASDTRTINTTIANIVIFTFDIFVIFVAVYLVSINKIDASKALIATIAMMSSFGPTMAIANLASTIQNTIAAAKRVTMIIDEKPLIDEVKDKEKIDNGDIKVRDVSFSYDKELILDDINLDIEKGNILAISGRSGSGKSTLLKLIMRFYDVDQGKIIISDRDVKEVNSEDLRTLISYMVQDTIIFSDSIKNNLKIAKLDATDEEIIKAAKKAKIHDLIIGLKDGYDTKVAELGTSLSAGERQRLGLARIFLRDSQVILLDEPTSNLDSLNEGMILRSLKEEMKDKTIVIVSHRESALRIADKEYKMTSARLS